MHLDISSIPIHGDEIHAWVNLFASHHPYWDHRRAPFRGPNTHIVAQLEFIGGIKALPWVIKPVYGILSDAVPLLGYHRRSYLIIFGLLGQLSDSL